MTSLPGSTPVTVSPAGGEVTGEGVHPGRVPVQDGVTAVTGEGAAVAPLPTEQLQLRLHPRSRYTSEEIIAAYKATGSVWRAGKQLGIAGQTVHDHLRALGYKLQRRNWSAAEVTELRSLIENRVPLGQIAGRLGRPYAGVAGKASELGVKSRPDKRKKKVPRGIGFDKASTLKHMAALERGGCTFTRYARMHSLSVEMLARALQQHCPDRWSGYVACRSDLPSATCEYCATEFIPFTRKQRFCDRKCGDSARVDNSYFGGKRRSTIGLADGVCQLCERQVDSGLSSHHVFGKENDPDNNVLVALCRGCHHIVGTLASRVFVDNEAAWESLISLVWMRKHGAEITSGTTEGNTIHVCVDIDVYEDDEEQDVPA